MRVFFLFAILVSSLVVKAQTVFPVSFMDYVQRTSFGNNNYTIAQSANKKWFLNSYSGISTSFNFFNGGNATVVSVPVGLQLSRKLNENLYAFAAVSAAPAYINFSGSFLSNDFTKGYSNNSPFKSNSFGVYQRAELGLMYVNDAKTFSISGSVGVQRSSYPLLPYQQMNRTRQNNITPANN